MNQIQAIILAAGQGTRMNHSELPKVLVPLSGRPIISYVLDTLHQVGVANPVIVIKYKADLVRQTLGLQQYVEQDERSGTGAAAQAAATMLGDIDGLIYITNGDCPCFSKKTYQLLAEAMTDKGIAVTLATSEVQSVDERYGRVLRKEDGSVERIVEYKDATEAERQVREYNAGLYLVRSPWIWQALERIQPSGVTGEYYLTDIVSLAIDDGFKVAAVPVAQPSDAHGINTPEELAVAEKLLKERGQSVHIAI